MAIEKEDFLEAMHRQRADPVGDSGNEGRWSERDRAGETEMVLPI